MSEIRNLSVTVRKGVLGGLICGCSAFIGGLIGGPIGIGVGSAIGGAISTIVLRFRSIPNIVENDFTGTERTEIVERGRQAIIDAKEAILKLLLQLISALLKCNTKREIIDAVLLPILKELTEVTIRSILRYLTGH